MHQALSPDLSIGLDNQPCDSGPVCADYELFDKDGVKSIVLWLCTSGVASR